MKTSELLEIVTTNSTFTQYELHEIQNSIKKYARIEQLVDNWSANYYHTHDYMRLIQDIIQEGREDED